MHTRDHIALGKLEAEALGVVGNRLNLLENQGQPALVTAGEGGLGRANSLGRLALGLLGGAFARGGRREVVAGSTNGSSSGGVKKGVGTAFGRLGSVRSRDQVLCFGRQ